MLWVVSLVGNRFSAVGGPIPRSSQSDEIIMATSNFRSVDEYIAHHPVSAQVVLKRLRGVIRRALPDAEEVISYNIPTYKLEGRSVLYFAGWKQHYSLYPAGARLVARFGDQLAPYVVSKGTIRFPLSQPIPVKLIVSIANFRVKELSFRDK
jgi:uncharacterized protein YdhG (YjbR/CyaY superfamily)